MQKAAKNTQNWQISALNAIPEDYIHGKSANLAGHTSGMLQKTGQFAHTQHFEIAKNALIEQGHCFCEVHFWH
jgi:hypothetical protein